jgi:hypothetical protein
VLSIACPTPLFLEGVNDFIPIVDSANDLKIQFPQKQVEAVLVIH